MGFSAYGGKTKALSLSDGEVSEMTVVISSGKGISTSSPSPEGSSS